MSLRLLGFRTLCLFSVVSYSWRSDTPSEKLVDGCSKVSVARRCFRTTCCGFFFVRSMLKRAPSVQQQKSQVFCRPLPLCKPQFRTRLRCVIVRLRAQQRCVGTRLHLSCCPNVFHTSWAEGMALGTTTTTTTTIPIAVASLWGHVRYDSCVWSKCLRSAQRAVGL